MLHRFAVGAQIGVDRRKIGLFRQGLLLRAVGFACGKQQPRIFGPISRGIRQIQRSPHKAAGGKAITTHFRIACAGQMFFGGEIIGDVQVRQNFRLPGHPGHFPILHKPRKVGTTCFGAVLHPRCRRNHKTGIGPFKRLRIAFGGFRKARPVAAVKGKGLAFIVGDASSLARLKGGVKN